MTEAQFVVRLFEIQLQLARNLAASDMHPHDIALNASAAVEAYIEAEA